MDLESLSGFAAMGKPVPDYRKANAYEAARDMGMRLAEDRWSIVSGMSEQLARDKPYEAMEIGLKYLDLTGAYRIMAVLLSSERGQE